MAKKQKSVSEADLGERRARLRDDGRRRFTLSIVLTYSENTDQYSLSPPKDLRMKKAPDIRSISPTNFIPRKSAGETRTFYLIATLLAMFVVLNHLLSSSCSQISRR